MTAGAPAEPVTSAAGTRVDLGRVFALLLLIGALAPGLWWRSEWVPLTRTGTVTFLQITDAAARRGEGEVQLAGVWRLTSRDSRFGGYSAMVVRADGKLRAYSDSGLWLEFDAPDNPTGIDPRFGDIRGGGGKYSNDVEAAAYDPETGITWLALEFVHAIRRISHETVEVAPPAMAHFRQNGGAEAMVRLPDGRFLLLAESAEPLSPRRRTGLLFATDPVIDDRATAFDFEPPLGYDPSDAALLPDGRVLILLRALSFTNFPPFAARLVVADPADIEAGKPWSWREVAHLSGVVPPDNYEGLAVVPGESGLVLWLISDANQAVLLQRTLLVKLVWNESDAPRNEAPPQVRRPQPPS